MYDLLLRGRVSDVLEVKLPPVGRCALCSIAVVFIDWIQFLFLVFDMLIQEVEI